VTTGRLCSTPGERVRLRFINASAMTNLQRADAGPAADHRPVPMGSMCSPVETVDEFQITVAETFDVIVHADRRTGLCTIVGEAVDRSGLVARDAGAARRHGRRSAAAPRPASR
jgi:FtsP/CotA-like multicopper oxidase with cupredoxin domain